MSLNVIFVASREIQVVKTGVIDLQTTTLDVWQTPTEVSLRITRAEDPVAEYKVWVMEQKDCVYEQDLFAEDDVWCEHPISTEIVDPRIEHIAALDVWIKEMTQNSWVVSAEII